MADGRQKYVNLWNKRVNINFLQPIIIKLYFRGGGGATCNFEYDLKNSRGHQSSVSYNYWIMKVFYCLLLVMDYHGRDLLPDITQIPLF